MSKDKSSKGASVKHLMVDKANTTIVIAVGIAAFVTVFSLVTSRALLSKRSYQARVIATQEQARDQLQLNIEAVNSLKVAYQQFVDRPTNIIDGNSNGSGERDGDNAKIILDALPSKYDFPAVASSLEKIAQDRGYIITKIGGSDGEAVVNSAPGSGQSTQTSSTPGVAAPVITSSGAVEMPFEIGTASSYAKAIDFLGVFRSSIRPMYIDKIAITAAQGNIVELLITGKTFYQPEKTLSISEEVVQ